MLRIDRATVGGVSDLVPGLLLALDRPVVAFLADGLQVVKIEEQIPIAAVRFHVMHDERENPFPALAASFTDRLIS